MPPSPPKQSRAEFGGIPRAIPAFAIANNGAALAALLSVGN